MGAHRLEGHLHSAPGLRPDAGQARRPAVRRAALCAPGPAPQRLPASSGPPGGGSQDKLPPRPRGSWGSARPAAGAGLARTRWTGAAGPWPPRLGRRPLAAASLAPSGADPGRGSAPGPVPREGAGPRGRARRPLHSPSSDAVAGPLRLHPHDVIFRDPGNPQPQAPPCYLTAAAASTSRRHEAPRRGPALR